MACFQSRHTLSNITKWKWFLNLSKRKIINADWNITKHYLQRLKCQEREVSTLLFLSKKKKNESVVVLDVRLEIFKTWPDVIWTVLRSPSPRSHKYEWNVSKNTKHHDDFKEKDHMFFLKGERQIMKWIKGFKKRTTWSFICLDVVWARIISLYVWTIRRSHRPDPWLRVK